MLQNEESFEPPLSDANMALLRAHLSPPESLENQIVCRLQQKRLLRKPATTTEALHRVAPLWLSLAAAAAVAFIAGVQVGRGRAPSPDAVPGVLAGAAGRDAASISKLVSQTALDYVTALAMVPAGDSAGAELAALTLLTAADQMARIAPQSDVVRALNLGPIEPLRLSSVSLSPSAPATQQQLIWY
jgi:hypothetical protein